MTKEEKKLIVCRLRGHRLIPRYIQGLDGFPIKTDETICLTCLSMSSILNIVDDYGTTVVGCILANES